MKHVVMFSGGVGSWAAAKRVAKRYGTKKLTLLFTDTFIEDNDLYRFLDEAAVNVGGDLVKIADGRDPWTIFRDTRILGNTRFDPCSRILKRELATQWVNANCLTSDTILYLGIDWTEIHRWERSKRFWMPYRVEAPMCQKPYINKDQMLEALRAEGIAVPRLYDMGFPHNNCGGFCIKAGQAHFKLLLEKMPDRYHYHEQKEEEFRQYLKANPRRTGTWDVAILRDRSGGKAVPITLRELREKVQGGREIDPYDWGGCGCFVDGDK